MNSSQQFDSTGNSVWIGKTCMLNGLPAKVMGRSDIANRLAIQSDDGSILADFTYSDVQKIMNRMRNRGQFFAS